MNVQTNSISDTKLTEESVEWAYKRAKYMQSNPSSVSESYGRRGMICAKQRDAKMLHVLEKATEIIYAQYLRQYGQYVQRDDIPENHKVVPTEVQMWREAYKMVDQGTPIENFKWIYGCAVELAYGNGG